MSKNSNPNARINGMEKAVDFMKKEIDKPSYIKKTES
jgi:hypothetical protein